MTNPLLDAALTYTDWGWALFPLHSPHSQGCSCHNSKCSSSGKHPRTSNGWKNASANHEQICAWWSRWPDANIGIATGAISNLLVIDLDNKEGVSGESNLALLSAPYGGVPPTLTASTGRGLHLYLRYPGSTVKNSAGTLAPGIDVRSDGGYVVAPPSRHMSGAQYQWVNPDQPIAELPEWLLTTTQQAKGGTAAKQDDGALPRKEEAMTDTPVIEGTRNDTLYKLACALRGQQGMNEEAINELVLGYNRTKCVPPLDSVEVRKLVKSACSHPAETATRKSLRRQELSPLYWFSNNCRESLASHTIMMMDSEQLGWYYCLRVHAWIHGGELPADFDKLWRLARASSKKRFQKRFEPALAEYELIEEDGVTKFRHPQWAAQYSDALDKWMDKRDSSRSGVAAKQAARSIEGLAAATSEGTQPSVQ